MTGQIPDTVIFENETFDLLSMQGDGIPSPGDFGLQPGVMHTACWRGYYVTYKIENDQLFLNDMTIRTINDQYPPLNGKTATLEQNNMVYHDINLPLGFTGMLQIGKDFIIEKYVHMGFQPPSSYGTVLTLHFENGIMTGKS